MTGLHFGKTSFFSNKIIPLEKRQTSIIFKHREDRVRKSLVTAKQPWDLQESSLVQTLADVGNIFGAVGNERIKNRRDNPYETFERRNRCGPIGEHLVEEPSQILWEELTWLCCEDEEEWGRARTSGGARWIEYTPGQDGRIYTITSLRFPNTVPKEGAYWNPAHGRPFSCSPEPRSGVTLGVFCTDAEYPYEHLQYWSGRNLSLFHLVHSTFICSRRISSHHPPFPEIIIWGCAGSVEAGNFAWNAELLSWWIAATTQKVSITTAGVIYWYYKAFVWHLQFPR